MPDQDTRSLNDAVAELRGRVSEFWDHLQNFADRLTDVEDGQ